VAKKGRSQKKNTKAAKAAKKTAPVKKAAKPVRKAATRTPAKPKTPKKTTVELKRLRKQFGLVLDVLAAKTSATPDVSAKLDDTRRRISQWMTDIDDICTPEMQEICGPDMAIPLP
jgi:hypothetical protein